MMSRAIGDLKKVYKKDLSLRAEIVAAAELLEKRVGEFLRFGCVESFKGILGEDKPDKQEKPEKCSVQ